MKHGRVGVGRARQGGVGEQGPWWGWDDPPFLDPSTSTSTSASGSNLSQRVVAPRLLVSELIRGLDFMFP